MRTEPAQPTAAQARLNATMGVSGASRRWDAIVIGAGCAGSVIARELSLAGRSVLLVDKAVFPRAKVCGCCLNAAALALLSRIGLGDLASSLGAAPLLSVSLAAGRAAATLAIPT
ncbi:MAG: FAD-dependent monooxygenase, partial [Pyrinomonadaceae bacterium]|nr:FAD-dependent monooxygenase [Phycisphaerales bacterium]